MIKSQSELERVRVAQGGLRQLSGISVSLKGLLSCFLLLSIDGKLGLVAEVISLHFVEEDLSLIGLRVGHKELFKEI